MLHHALRGALLLCCIGTAALLRAQYDPQFEAVEKQPSPIARYCTQALRERGVLIVRLHTQQKGIEAARQRGQHAVAERMAREREAENRQIVAAFRSAFDFCPVYFCYTEATPHLRQGRIRGHLLTDDLRLDAQLQPERTFFLIAEFGVYHDPWVQYPASDAAPATGTHRYANPLVVYDPNLVQLRPPFPVNPARGNNPVFRAFVPQGKRYQQAVQGLNRALHRYYAKL